MIESCNFKSKIMHHEHLGCRLTPPEDVCPGEENCILYQTYFYLKKKAILCQIVYILNPRLLLRIQELTIS